MIILEIILMIILQLMLRVKFSPLEGPFFG